MSIQINAIQTGLGEHAVRRMRALTSLPERELAALSLHDRNLERHGVGADVHLEGEAPRPRIIISGWAARRQVLSDGRCQIFGFCLPGDTIGLGPGAGAPLPYTVTALTPLRTLDAERIYGAAGGHSALRRASERLRAEEHRELVDQVVRLGRLGAYERLAHLLLDLHRRLETVGLATERQFPLPLTQEILADALGLSNVHTNRVVQQLRRDGVVEIKGRVAYVRDRERLHAICGVARRSEPDHRAVGREEPVSWEPAIPRARPGVA